MLLTRKGPAGPRAPGRAVGQFAASLEGSLARALMLGALDAFGELQGRELFLESSSKLGPALALYESVGFRHYPAPRPGSHYARADVYMVCEPDRAG